MAFPPPKPCCSHVDGERGELIIAGKRCRRPRPPNRLRGGDRAVVERRNRPDRWPRRPCGANLGAARQRAFARLPDLLGASRGLSIVDGVRAAIAGLRAENGLPHEATIVGALPVIAGALVQRGEGNDPVAPDPNASHAADTLSMMLDRQPDPREVAALDAYLVTVCDHGLNASTFAARVVASTRPTCPRR